MYLNAAQEDEITREYIANALYLLVTDQRMDASAPRLGALLRTEETDTRSGREIVDGLKEKLARRRKGANDHGRGD